MSRPHWGRDNICVAAVGGKTPDLSSERRTFADVMTENKLKATQVTECYGGLMLINSWRLLLVLYGYVLFWSGFGIVICAYLSRVI